MNVEEWMNRISEGKDYDNSPMKIDFSFGGSHFDRSVIELS